MKKLLISLFLSLVPLSLANANVIELDFNASDFVGFNFNSSPPSPSPVSSVSGKLTWNALSISSAIQQLLSVDLSVNGTSYTLNDIEFDDWGFASLVGGKNFGASGSAFGTDDFQLLWLYSPSNSSPNFSYTTSQDASGAWQAQTITYSFTEKGAAVAEPSSFVLFAITMFGLILFRRKVKA